MALNTEIGGALADSYGEISEYHLYVLNHYGKDISTGEVVDDEANLRKATQNLDSNYSWKGSITASSQFLEFPRNFPDLIRGRIIANDVIPQDIKNAVFEIAYALKNGVDISPVIQGGLIKKKSSKVGSLSTTKEYDRVYASPTISIITTMISPYYTGSVNNSTRPLSR